MILDSCSKEIPSKSDTEFNLLIGVNALLWAVWALVGENDQGSKFSECVFEEGIDDFQLKDLNQVLWGNSYGVYIDCF